MTTEKKIDAADIHFKYKALYIGSGATAVLIISFCIIAKYLNISYEIRDLISMLTCGIVITALIYSAKSLKLNFDANNALLEFEEAKFKEEKELRVKELRIQKEKYTLEVSGIWFKPEMAHNVETARTYLRTNKDKLLNGPILNVIDDLNDNLDTRKAVVCVLNFFENLCLLIILR